MKAGSEEGFTGKVVTAIVLPSITKLQVFVGLAAIVYSWIEAFDPADPEGPIS